MNEEYELCRYISERVNWQNTEFYYCHGEKKYRGSVDTRELHEHFGYFDVEYLLDKLPSVLEDNRFLTLSHPDVARDGTGWVAGYTTNVDDIIMRKVTFKYDTAGNTPRLALLKLTKKLIEEKVI